VQQPKVTATRSCEISWRAFSANSGQFDAGSTTTASSGRPITPPVALICSIAISTVFFSAVSEIAIVPDNECSTPTLIGERSCAKSRLEALSPGRASAAPAAAFRMSRRCVMVASMELHALEGSTRSIASPPSFATTMPTRFAPQTHRRSAERSLGSRACSESGNGIVHGYQLGAVREGRLDLDLRDHLGHSLHDVVATEQRRSVVHEVG